MVRTTDKDMAKFREQASVLAQELNSKKQQVNALSDEVRDEQVLVGSLENKIHECKEIIEVMQLLHEQMVDDYEDKLTEATEGIYVSGFKRVHHSMLSTFIKAHVFCQYFVFKETN